VVRNRSAIITPLCHGNVERGLGDEMFFSLPDGKDMKDTNVPLRRRKKTIGRQTTRGWTSNEASFDSRVENHTFWENLTPFVIAKRKKTIHHEGVHPLIYFSTNPCYPCLSGGRSFLLLSIIIIIIIITTLSTTTRPTNADDASTHGSDKLS